MGIDPRLPGLTADREPGEAIPAALAADDGSSRRAFLTKIAIGGAALTVGSQLVPATRLFPVSGAQDGDEVVLDADETQIRFLTSIALAAADTYRASLALTAVALPEPMLEVIAAFGHHHTQQADTLVTLLPETVTIETIPANPSFLAEQTSAVEGAESPEDILGVLRALEETVAATQYVVIGARESQDDARLVATLLPICAQHATVLGTLEGGAPADVLPEAQGDEGALSADDHPIGDATEAEPDAPTGDSTTTANQGGDGAEEGSEGDTGQTGEGTDSSGGGATDDTDSGDSSATTEG